MIGSPKFYKELSYLLTFKLLLYKIVFTKIYKKKKSFIVNKKQRFLFLNIHMKCNHGQQISIKIGKFPIKLEELAAMIGKKKYQYVCYSVYYTISILCKSITRVVYYTSAYYTALFQTSIKYV